VNAVYFYNTTIWGQFGLQFVLAAMSVWGWLEWRKPEGSPLLAREV
jgi:nicotinamide mononucleotide transporter